MTTRELTCEKPAERALGRPRDLDLAERRCCDILRCAIQHFAKDGYQRADIDALAKDAGCAKGTVFRYFPTKRALFEGAVDRVMREMLAATECDELEDPVENMVKSIRASLAFFDAHPEYVELLIQERSEFRDRARPSFFEYIQNHCDPERGKTEAMIKSGRVRKMPVDRLLDVGLNLLYGTIFTNYFARRLKTFEQQADDVLDVFLHGVLSKEESAKRLSSKGVKASVRHVKKKRS